MDVITMEQLKQLSYAQTEKLCNVVCINRDAESLVSLLSEITFELMVDVVDYYADDWSLSPHLEEDVDDITREPIADGYELFVSLAGGDSTLKAESKYDVMWEGVVACLEGFY